MKTATNPASDTRERLLEAAAQVFSEHGFRAATVREIVARAGGANIAAVNYHFGDKEGLYAAVLGQSAVESLRKHPPHGGLPPDAPPEAQLRAFVLAFLLRITDRGQEATYGRLMAREMIEPTAALDRLVDQAIRPMYRQLCSIVKAIAGAAASGPQIERCAKSIVGQCLFYKHCAPVISRIDGRLPSGPREIAELAEHISAFSLRGLRGIAPKGRVRR